MRTRKPRTRIYINKSSGKIFIEKLWVDDFVMAWSLNPDPVRYFRMTLSKVMLIGENGVVEFHCNKVKDFYKVFSYVGCL